MPQHIIIVCVENLDEVRPSKMRRIQQPGERRGRMLFRPMHLEEPSIHVRADVFAFLCHMRLYTDVEVLLLVFRYVPLLATADVVEQIRKPQQMVPVAHHPVKIDAAVIVCNRSSTVNLGSITDVGIAGMIGSFPRDFSGSGLFPGLPWALSSPA